MSEIVPGMSDEEPEPKKGGILSWLKEIGCIVLAALVVSTLLRVFVVQMFQIPSESMEKTLMIGDRIAVQKVVPWGRGDVVVFKDVYGWLGDEPEDPGWFGHALIFVGLAPDTANNYLVKRVIGTEGDRVACCDVDGRVTVNGYALDEDAYIWTDQAAGEKPVPSAYSFDVTVPKGAIFVMGDHRNHSADSRFHFDDVVPGLADGEAAFVPASAVQGSVAAVVFPFTRFSLLSRPAVFDSVPAPTSPAPDKPVITQLPTAR
ncbi:MAG: signal peptidase I [Propionibacteriaceae bacterium]|nr:signal peptidase I [Propionibacteriaceae bacterium]